jgi:hypothetical protein
VDVLARALPDEERKALLQRISRSLNIQDATRQRIIHSELHAERKNELIRADMERLSLGERVRLWFKGFFSPVGERERFLAFRLSQARQRVQSKNAELADFESRYFLPGLPEKMRDLCRGTEPVRGFFSFVWKDAEALRSMLSFLLAKRIPDSKHTLNQFCSTRELQELFRATESRNQLRQLVLERISEYIESIPDSVMEELEHGLKPLYLYKDLVLFDFDSFFAIFQSSKREALSEGDVSFHSAAVQRSLDTVEELYLAMHYCSRIKGDPEVFDETLHYYYAVQDGHTFETGLEEIPESEKSRTLHQLIVTLAREVSRIRQEIPLGDIIRYFRNDPYYRFLAYSPQLRLRDFYYSNLKMRMLDELDNRFQELRMGVMGRMIQEVLPSGLKEFEFFHPEIQSGIKRSGVANLQVHRPLQFVLSFIEKIYRPAMMDFLRITGRLIPSRSRQRSADLTLYIAGLDDVVERLREFDLSFSPDSDEGKTFYRYRFSTTERDKTQISSYKALVAQKERDAKGIIEKFLDQLTGIKTAFETIKRANYAHLNERYRNYESTLADDRPFDARLDGYIKTIESSQKLINQLIAIEMEE